MKVIYPTKQADHKPTMVRQLTSGMPFRLVNHPVVWYVKICSVNPGSEAHNVVRIGDYGTFWSEFVSPEAEVLEYFSNAALNFGDPTRG